MSLLIKGANMPENCILCPCSDNDSFYCHALNRYTPMTPKPMWCPLVEVEDEEGE